MMRPTYLFKECKHEKETVKLLVSKSDSAGRIEHPIAKCDHCGQLRFVTDPSEFVAMVREPADE